MHHKYLYHNYQMLPTYRRYNDFVPVYLHRCPRQIIIHCLGEGVTAWNFVMKISLQEIFLMDYLHFRVPAKLIPLILALHQVNLHALVQIGWDGIFHANISLQYFEWWMDRGGIHFQISTKDLHICVMTLLLCWSIQDHLLLIMVLMKLLLIVVLVKLTTAVSWMKWCPSQNYLWKM